MATTLATLPWGALLILMPLAGGLACFLFPAVANPLGLLITFAGVLAVAGLALHLLDYGEYLHAVGGWGAPLGIDLHADGLSLMMLAMTALVGFGVSIYATAYFKPGAAAHFWPLWLLLQTALNALAVAGDLFNLYVTLELMGLAAVALTALQGGHQALVAAMRYLLATLLGSLTYLLGVVLLYHGYGSLDLAQLAARVETSALTMAALGLTGAGLILKSALFPLHFWLPSAHASAPAPVSALLSALVVKASIYILLRLWLALFAPLAADITDLFAVLGGGAVLWGSWQALQQSRVKLLIAYSTVAQIGYLFLAFPLAPAMGLTAWQAMSYLMLSHALAKAAMFLAAGNLVRFAGHDRIADLDRVVQRLPLTAGAFALAGVSIMGLPPSGGFNGKWLLLQAAVAQGRWDLAAIILLGGLMAAGYVFKVIGHSFTQATVLYHPRLVPARMEWAALLLAGAAVLIGLLGSPLLALLAVGDPFALDRTAP